MSPEALASEAARVMWSQDRAAQSLGMRLIDVTPGGARMEMQVSDFMTNGHGICHGGYVFLLADTAFAYACNSRNQRAVAAGAEIHFLAPAQVGDLLSASATERERARRSGIYDVEVRNQHEVPIALFRGRCATIKGTLVPDIDGADAPTGDGPP